MEEILVSLDRQRADKSKSRKSKQDDDWKITINWYSPIYNMHMYWTKQKPEVVADYINRYCPPGGTVLDAFAGSGMTGVAALLSGRNALLSDLSPLCIFLAENFTTKVPTEDLVKEFKKITASLESKYNWLYRTSCHSCSNPNAFVYAVVLADNFSCPECGHIQNMCEGGAHLKLKKGDTIRHIRCSACSHRYEKEMKFFHSSSPISIEVECSLCNREGKENARQPTSADRKWLKQIDDFKIRVPYPSKIKFPLGINTKRCLLRKLTHPYQLFSKMNLIYLSAYWNEVEKGFEANRYSKTLRDKLRFIATSAMFHGSLMRRWLPYRTGVPLKGTLFVPSMSEDIRFSRVLSYQAERVFKGQVAINQISNRGRVKAKVASALELDWIEDGTVDYLYYDPPFGGHINYSELNLVWEAWLGQTTETRDEVIVNHHQNKTMDDYASLLRKALAEGAKKLKTGGHLTIVFAHSDLKVWRTLQEAVSGLPLRINGAPEVLDSANKTFIQLYSDRAQQNMITFTFKKTRAIGTKLTHDFKKQVGIVIDRLLKDSSGGLKREDIFDQITRVLFSTSYFEDFDLDTYLSKHYLKKGVLWFEKRTKYSSRIGAA